jgi:hypothetical protein
MFFVTLLLNKVVAWMRRQSGSNRLRALLYMDEIYGFFPPVKNPPSKEPMITLLKQARAYGFGVVLSTQNPVDLDYKGLSNIGTWFIGRLQTTQDIERVIDGLGGKIDSSFDKKEIKNLLANLQKRTFFLKSAHLEDVRLFGTRWVLSYLKGPLKKDEISTLMADKKELTKTEETTTKEPTESNDYVKNIVLDSSITQRYEPDTTGRKRYTPTVAAKVNVIYSDTRRAIEEHKEFDLFIDADELSSCDWDEAEVLEEPINSFPSKKPQGALFRHISPSIEKDKGLKQCKRDLVNHIYQNKKLELYRNKKLRLESKLGDSYDDFVVKLEDVLREKFEEELEKLKDRYKSKFDRLEAQIHKAELQLEKEKSDQTSSIITAGMSILGALFGKGSISKIGTAVNRSSRALKERSDIGRASAKLEELQERLQELQEELEEKINELDEKYNIDNYEIDTIYIKPKKSNIDVEDIEIIWRVDF